MFVHVRMWARVVGRFVGWVVVGSVCVGGGGGVQQGSERGPLM